MPRTLDVDYLLALHGSKAPPLHQALVYRYRSGVLIPRLRAALQASPGRHRTPLIAGTLPLRAGFGRGELIDTLQVFHWPVRAGGDLDDAALDNSVAQLTAGGSGASVHLVPHDSAATERRAWRTVERTCLLIEEPLITAESLEPVLRYLAATSDLRPAADLLTQPGFVKSFAGLIVARVELPEIVQAFDERVLVGTDPATNRFDPERLCYDAVRRLGRRAPLRHLRDLVARRDARDLVDLVGAFDEQRFEHGGTAFALVATLYAISRQLLEPPAERLWTRKPARSRLTTAASQEAILWSALVLSWEDSLSRSVREETDGYRRGPDLLVSSISGLGRDFLARASWPDGRDLLTDRWAGIRRAVARCAAGSAEDRLSTVRDNLVHALAAAHVRQPDGLPAWLVHLRATLGGASASTGSPEDGTGQDVTQSSMKDAACPPPTTLEAVTGRRYAVAALLRHARDRSDGVDLLLYGPAGVGKRTLARLYAQALLYDQPLPGQTPCSLLDDHPGYIEVDGAHVAIDAHTRAVVETIGATSIFTDRTVIVVRNADRYPASAFDHLLKPMEDNPRACFVLLAQNPDGVRTAGRSRCYDYRVRPLDRPESQTLAWQILSAQGVTCDAEALALIADVGAGLPRQLHNVCRLVADVASLGREAIQFRLGFDWAEPYGARWPEILSKGSDVVPDDLQSTSVGRAEHTRRVQAILQFSYLYGRTRSKIDSDTLNPALRYIDEAFSSALMGEFSTWLSRIEFPAKDNWDALITEWLSDRTSGD